MNPLLSPTSSLFLPLSQLGPHCNRLLSSLSDGRTSQKERILFEQTLWNEVKKIRTLKDPSVFLYLIGYYHTILYRIADGKPPNNDLFEYHVLIRLGDLNRYMERIDVAEYYYCNARNLFPHFGHAYNQLGLLTKPSNCFKCCYYYARAAKSTDKPLNTIADSNLRIAVSKYDCEILNHILNEQACIDIADSKGRYDKLPGTAFEWFYVIVVAIYADNIQPITKLFLSYMNENFSTQKATTIIDNVRTTSVYCDRESYVLLACLDILLDWLKLGSQGRAICSNVSGELRDIRTCLQTTINTCRTDLSKLADVDKSMNSIGGPTAPTAHSLFVNPASRLSINLSPHSHSTTHDLTASATDSSKTAGTLITGRVLALPHDYVLRGFGPLDCVHRELTFRRRVRNKDYIMKEEANDKKDHQKVFIDTSQLVQISTRIDSKINSFGPVVRRRTRNIALESILQKMEKDTGDL